MLDKNLYTLITGSGRGIGRAIATEMASRGHNLIMHSLPGEDLEKTASELAERYNINVRSFEVDLTESEGPMNLFRAVESEGLSVNVLVNNAGVGIEGPLEAHSGNDIDRILFLNIRAMTILTSLFVPGMRRTRSYILNVSSFGTYIPTPYKSVYLATKTYIFYFTRSLQAEFKGSSIRTCVFLPAGVRTNANVLNRIETAGWVSKRTSLTPEQVASKGLRAMFRGKKVYIPGGLARLVFSIALFVPEGIILAITRSLFRHEHAI